MVNGNNIQSINTKIAAIKYRINQHLNFCGGRNNISKNNSINSIWNM